MILHSKRKVKRFSSKAERKRLTYLAAATVFSLLFLLVYRNVFYMAGLLICQTATYPYDCSSGDDWKGGDDEFGRGNAIGTRRRNDLIGSVQILYGATIPTVRGSDGAFPFKIGQFRSGSCGKDRIVSIQSARSEQLDFQSVTRGRSIWRCIGWLIRKKGVRRDEFRVKFVQNGHFAFECQNRASSRRRKLSHYGNLPACIGKVIRWRSDSHQSGIIGMPPVNACSECRSSLDTGSYYQRIGFPAARESYAR